MIGGAIRILDKNVWVSVFENVGSAPFSAESFVYGTSPVVVATTLISILIP